MTVVKRFDAFFSFTVIENQKYLNALISLRNVFSCQGAIFFVMLKVQAIIITLLDIKNKINDVDYLNIISLKQTNSSHNSYLDLSFN